MSLREEIEQLKQENAELRKALNEALEIVKELRNQLSQNSQNSNWPSSRDKGKKKRRTKSLRQKSEKKAGGQAGHKGHTLEFSSESMRIENHRPKQCSYCDNELERAVVKSTQCRQVVDIPPLHMEVCRSPSQPGDLCVL